MAAALGVARKVACAPNPGLSVDRRLRALSAAGPEGCTTHSASSVIGTLRTGRVPRPGRLAPRARVPEAVGANTQGCGRQERNRAAAEGTGAEPLAAIRSENPAGENPYPAENITDTSGRRRRRGGRFGFGLGRAPSRRPGADTIPSITAPPGASTPIKTTNQVPGKTDGVVSSGAVASVVKTDASQPAGHARPLVGLLSAFGVWSGREDLNLRPHRPERCALPSCATPRPRVPVEQGLRMIAQAGGRHRWTGLKPEPRPRRTSAVGPRAPDSKEDVTCHQLP